MVHDSDATLTLPDGRALGWATYGDREGVPVVAHHGCPDSRIIWRLVDEAARRQGIRLVAVDRPGFGLSDPRPGRRVVDWPADVVHLVDDLGFDRFAVVGLSGGGAFATACAALLPDRVQRLGLVSVIGPLDRPGMTAGMSRAIRVTYGLARRAPTMLRLGLSSMARSVRRNPERATRRLSRTRPPGDRDVIERPEVRDVLLAALPQNFRDPASVAWELQLAVRPWGFDLTSIDVPTIVWQGGADDVHPPVMGRYLAQAIPTAELVSWEGATAFGLLDRAEEVMARFGKGP